MTHGLRVLCLSNMWPGPDDPDYGSFVRDMCAALEARGAAVTPVAIDRRRGGPARTPAKYAALAARAARRAGGVDVVYAHFLFPTGAAAAIAARVGRVPYVLTAHGQDVRNLDRATVRRATAPVLRGARELIAVSGHLADALRATGLALPPLSVIDMGVDTERFRPGDRAAARSRLGIGAEGPLVLAVGGLTERKNPLGLLQAFARVRAARPDARLAFVGDGPLAGAVDAGARRLGVAGAVLRPGALPHERVADWVAACDVLALVSLVEPLGIVALEALAGGRPVVATAVGGTREVVPDPAAGRVVDPRDPGAIARAIGELLDEPPAEAACRAAAEEHSLARQAARVEEVLRRALRPRPARA
ncbi:glycosyltransferase [Miltoncostaea marina]|uniref:glycosyltransferase n=1 Tax=Miltoncostaea marina TaxID=2843215 RepID=UPI001C3CFB07|nr:glycosyltransferase [Miltoncostaea marina]